MRRGVYLCLLTCVMYSRHLLLSRKLPPVLIFHLKRFKYSSRGSRFKIEDYVDFPLKDLDMGSFVQSPQRDEPVYRYFELANNYLISYLIITAAVLVVLYFGHKIIFVTPHFNHHN